MRMWRLQAKGTVGVDQSGERAACAGRTDGSVGLLGRASNVHFTRLAFCPSWPIWGPGDMPLHPHPSPPPLPPLRQTAAPSQCSLFYDQTNILLELNTTVTLHESPGM